MTSAWLSVVLLLVSLQDAVGGREKEGRKWDIRSRAAFYCFEYFILTTRIGLLIICESKEGLVNGRRERRCCRCWLLMFSMYVCIYAYVHLAYSYVCISGCLCLNVHIHRDRDLVNKRPTSQNALCGDDSDADDMMTKMRRSVQKPVKDQGRCVDSAVMCMPEGRNMWP